MIDDSNSDGNARSKHNEITNSTRPTTLTPTAACLTVVAATCQGVCNSDELDFKGIAPTSLVVAIARPQYIPQLVIWRMMGRDGYLMMRRTLDVDTARDPWVSVVCGLCGCVFWCCFPKSHVPLLIQLPMSYAVACTAAAARERTTCKHGPRRANATNPEVG